MCYFAKWLKLANFAAKIILFNMNFLTHLRKLCLIAVVACALSASAIDGLRYNVEGEVSFSNGQNTPFWLVNNKQGLSSIKKDNGYLRAGIFRDIEKDKRFSWGAGADIVGAYNYTSSFIIQQLYAEIKYRCLGAMIGSKEINGEFNNPRLSSGNLLYSGNARPVPQVRVGIPDYTIVPHTKNWLAVKGYVAYGMFTDDDWQYDFAAPNSKRTKHVLYHSKGLFIKVQNLDKFPAWFEGGLEMAAQFGGRALDGNKWIDMPNSLKDFLKAFIPSSGGSNTPMGEQTNCYGNHVGSWNARIGWNITPKWNVGLYYEHFFEDHSQMFFDYDWRDGLWGVEVSFPENPVISTLVYEFLYTKDQSGPVYWDHTPEIPEQVSGRDNYYNHYIYTGWQHWGMGIGNPLIISPIYNRDGQIVFRSNRVIGHHVGFMGRPTKELEYRVLLSYTRNWGTYTKPLKDVLSNANGLLEITYRPKWLEGMSGTLSFGADRGGMLGHSCGAMLTLRKTGWL